MNNKPLTNYLCSVLAGQLNVSPTDPLAETINSLKQIMNVECEKHLKSMQQAFAQFRPDITASEDGLSFTFTYTFQGITHTVHSQLTDFLAIAMQKLLHEESATTFPKPTNGWSNYNVEDNDAYDDSQLTPPNVHSITPSVDELTQRKSSLRGGMFGTRR